MTKRWPEWVGWLGDHQTEMRLGLRILLAGMLAFVITDLLFRLPQSYWAVLTAIIVMQTSVGGALKASLDRIAGTLLGALWGCVVALTVPHHSPALLAAALALALAPLGFLTAFRPAYRMAPVTAIIVLLGTASQAAGPFVPALERVLEIGIGSMVGMAVSLLVLPARAHRLLAEAAAETLDALADQVHELPSRLAGRADPEAWQALADRRRAQQEKAESLSAEAARERRNRLTDEPDPEPMVRTLRRLGQDTAMLGRATRESWEAALQERLADSAGRAAAAIEEFLRGCAMAQTARRAPPPILAVTAALEAYGEAVAEVRREGLTRGLPGNAVERVFGLGFALDQLCRDAGDLAERVADSALPAADPETRLLQ